MIKDNKVHIAATLLLTVLTCAVYAGVLDHSFLLNWDDYTYIIRNDMITGISWEHVKTAFSRPYFYNYSPLHLISYMVDYSLFGGIKPAGFFFVNILIHAVNGIILYVLVLRLSGKAFVGFIAAFIFLLHPVQVESVAWISQRKNVLAMLFFLTAFWGYVAYRDGSTTRKTSYYLLSLTAFTCALLSKSVAVILPVVLLVYDLCYLEQGGRKGWFINKIPYAAASAVIALVTIRSQDRLVEAGKETFHTNNPVETLYTMLPVLGKYLGILFWPVELSAVYILPSRFRPDSAVVSAGVLVTLLAGAGYLLYRRQRKLFFWYLLFFIGLIPVSHIIPLPTLMNDRYLYFPLIGAAVFMAYSFNALCERDDGTLRNYASAAVFLLLLSLPLMAWHRTSVWKNDTSLWLDVTRKEPLSTQAWSALAMSYYDAGRLDDALDAYLRTLAIDPNYQTALNNIGGLYNEMGEPEKARPYLIRVVQLFPGNFNGYMNLGNNYYMSGELKKAEEVFGRALPLDPASPGLHMSLGNVCLGLKKLEEARVHYRKALATGGTNPEIEYRLAGLEALSGHPKEALRHLQAAAAVGDAIVERIKSDPNLDSLRGYPEYKQLVR